MSRLISHVENVKIGDDIYGILCKKNPAKRRYVRPVSVFIKILVGGKGEDKSAKKQM